MIKNVLIIIT